MIGQQIGQYQIAEIIGEGGMATVYKAYHPPTDRYVAIKVLSRHLSSDPRFLTRFQREARVIAKLEHRSIVPIYDYGEYQGMPYIVMRLIESGTLRSRLYYRQLTLEKASRIIDQVAEALDHAHLLGIIHRDLKPSNILLDNQNNAYLTDFGIAKMLGSTTQVTASGVVGTPSYMSPEQCQGKELSGVSDIYALGAITFEIITGQPPYVADQPLTVMYSHVQDPIPSVQDVDPDLSDAFDPVIRKALAKKPAERYQKAVALAEDFRRVVTDVAPVEEQPQPDATPQRRIIPVPESDPDSEPIIVVDGDVFDDDSLVGVIPANDTYHPAVQVETPAGEYTDVDETSSPQSSAFNVLPVSLIGIIIIGSLLGIGLVIMSWLNAGDGTAIAPTLPPTMTQGNPIVVDTPSGGLQFTQTPLGTTGGIIMPTETGTVTEEASESPTSTVAKSPTTALTNTPVPPTSTPTITRTPTDTPTPTQTLTSTPTITQTPQLTGGTGLLAFTHGSNRDAEIAVIDANGLGFKQLTSNGYYDGEPDWSPDGGTIAFESRQAGNGDIWLMTAQGGNLRQLTSLPEAERHPDFSPDGSKIVYEVGDDAASEIWVMNADGSNPVRLTDNDYDDRVPMFSPDGTKITFMTRQRGIWEIAVMTYPAGEVTVYNCPSTDCRFPAWSPNGSKIGFNTLNASGDGDRLYLLDVASGTSSLLLGDGENGRIIWSGDGQWIFLNRTVEGNSDLYRMDPITLKLERITVSPLVDFGPDWTP